MMFSQGDKVKVVKSNEHPWAIGLVGTITVPALNVYESGVEFPKGAPIWGVTSYFDTTRDLVLVERAVAGVVGR